MRKLISLIIVTIIMFSCIIFPAFADTRSTKSVNYKIDNDTSDTANCYNIRNGYTAYIKDSDYYNGDLRRTYSNSSSDSYSWVRKTTFGNSVKNNPINLIVGVYLKSTVLSDSAASYWCMQKDGAYKMFTMNQTTHANGWSYYSYTINKNYQTAGWYSIMGIEVMPSHTGSGYSAADAISVSAKTYT